MLDIGAQTVLVPMMDTADDARRMVNAQRYPLSWRARRWSQHCTGSTWSRVPSDMAQAEKTCACLFRLKAARRLKIWMRSLRCSLAPSTTAEYVPTSGGHAINGAAPAFYCIIWLRTLKKGSRQEPQCPDGHKPYRQRAAASLDACCFMRSLEGFLRFSAETAMVRRKISTPYSFEASRNAAVLEE